MPGKSYQRLQSGEKVNMPMLEEQYPMAPKDTVEVGTSA